MATQKRRRPETVKVMVSEMERAELQAAADRADMPLSTFMRALVLAAVRSGNSVRTVSEMLAA